MRLNAKNERIKHRYFGYLKEAKQLDVQSIDIVAKALDRFEAQTRRRDFVDFRPDHATSFKRDLVQQVNRKTGEKLAAATVYSTLRSLKSFFFWLAGQSGYRSLRYDWADYFNASLKEIAVAKAKREQRTPSIDQIRSTLLAMPVTTSIEMRDRAVVAIAILTGARDDAIASFKLKHVDLNERMVFQDGREVRTKFSKTFSTWFFPVGDDIVTIVSDWLAHLRGDLGFGAEDPLFPATKTTFSTGGVIVPPSLGRDGWATSQPIRAIFKAAFAVAGLPYFNPHSFRRTLTRLGMEVCHKPEQLKAWSQNLGHDDVLTTFTSYGELPGHLQRDLIRSAGAMNEDDRLALELGRASLAAARSGKSG